MPWQVITLITPEENISVNGKVINVRNIESIKIDQNGGLTFIEKQVTKISQENAEFAGFEKAAIEDFNNSEGQTGVIGSDDFGAIGIRCPNASEEPGVDGEPGIEEQVG
jgi:hypothetical protein